MKRHILSAAALLVTSAALPGSANGQEAAQLKGAPVQLVAYAELRSDAVQTIALVPGYHMVIEFPYPVARLDVGDPELFSVDKYANKLTIKAKSPLAQETSVTISLADADLTVVPFIFKVDPHAPRVQVLRYTDPVERQLGEAKASLEREIESGSNERVSALAEKRLVQRLLLASAPTPVNKDARVSAAGGTVTLRIESAQQIPGPDGRPRLYLRYRLENATGTSINDLEMKVSSIRAGGSFWGKEVNTPYYDLDDTRTSSTIRSGAAILGLLSLETPELKSGETLSVTAVMMGGKKEVTVHQVLSGSGSRQ